MRLAHKMQPLPARQRADAFESGRAERDVFFQRIPLPEDYRDDNVTYLSASAASIAFTGQCRRKRSSFVTRRFGMAARKRPPRRVHPRNHAPGCGTSPRATRPRRPPRRAFAISCMFWTHVKRRAQPSERLLCKLPPAPRGSGASMRSRAHSRRPSSCSRRLPEFTPRSNAPASSRTWARICCSRPPSKASIQIFVSMRSVGGFFIASSPSHGNAPP